MTEDERREACELAKKILCELSKRKTRATYGAVGCILGVLPRGVGAYLGERCHKASWVVNKKTKKPTGYKESEIDPHLCCNPRVIESCCELRKWLGLPPASEHRPGCASYSKPTSA